MINTPVTPPTPRILDAPPSEAREVTQPLTADARTVPASHQGNERELAPLTYADSAGAPVPVAPVRAPSVAAPTQAPGGARPIVPGAETSAPPLITPAPPVPTVPAVVAAPPPQSTTNMPPSPMPAPSPTTPGASSVTVAPPEAHQPAASSTESPNRGAMHHDPDPQHRPTGGFGPAPSTEYNPLNGAEVCEMVLLLMDQIATQIPNDLRFSHALTYPRIECRVTVDVVTYRPVTAGGDIRITKIAPEPKGQASRAVALAHADECCFVIVAERREQDADGNPMDPPDKLRDELGLPRPHKHVVGTGTARQIVDVESPRTHDVTGNELGPDGTPIIAPARHALSGAGAQPRVTPGPVEPAPRPATGGPG